MYRHKGVWRRATEVAAGVAISLLFLHWSTTAGSTGWKVFFIIASVVSILVTFGDMRGLADELDDRSGTEAAEAVETLPGTYSTSAQWREPWEINVEIRMTPEVANSLADGAELPELLVSALRDCVTDHELTGKSGRALVLLPSMEDES